MSEKLSEENAAILRPLGALFTPVEQAEMFILSVAQVNMILDAARSEALSRRPDAPRADTGWMPKAVAEACEVVRSDAANTMEHTTTADLSARLMCRVDARKLGLVLAWVDRFVALPAPPQADGAQG